MARYVLYVETANLPKQKAEDLLEEMLEKIHKSDFLLKEDKVLCVSRRTGQTELVKID